MWSPRGTWLRPCFYLTRRAVSRGVKFQSWWTVALWQGSDSTSSSLATRCLIERKREKGMDEETESAPRTSVSRATLGDSKRTQHRITVKPQRKTLLLHANQLRFCRWTEICYLTKCKRGMSAFERNNEAILRVRNANSVIYHRCFN